jgi:hypothetical protein
MVVAYHVPEDVKRLVLLNRWKSGVCAGCFDELAEKGGIAFSFADVAATSERPAGAAQPVQAEALAFGVSLDRLQSVSIFRYMASFRERVRQLFVLVWAGVHRWRHGVLFDFYARDRAAQLLTQSLSAIQLDQLNRHGYFEVIGGDTGGRYRIRLGQQMNVERLDKYGKVVCLMCFLPQGRLPLADIMLAQKCALELFEQEADAVANRWTTRDDRYARRYS